MFKLIGQPDVLTKYTQLCMYGLPHVKARYEATIKGQLHTLCFRLARIPSLLSRNSGPLSRRIEHPSSMFHSTASLSARYYHRDHELHSVCRASMVTSAHVAVSGRP